MAKAPRAVRKVKKKKAKKKVAKKKLKVTPEERRRQYLVRRATKNIDKEFAKLARKLYG